MRRDSSVLPTRFRAALGLVAALAVTACPSKLAMTPQTFTLDPPPARPGPAAGATRVLSLRRAESAPTYSGVELVYRVGDHAIERDPYAFFAAPPAWLLTTAIRGYLREADWVRDVVVPGEGVPIDAEIEPSIVELAGDFSNASEPAAVMTLHFRVLAPAAGVVTNQEILLRTYTRRLPLSKRTAAAIVAAWNQELSEIMASFVVDLKAALPPAR
ncbi:MAG TPA: ABC-type transport auxiliary lipoprotein family protein [Thermoanaerobaculia bacterium]|nr:ABC-type transport auxiliary lipoprotein family protein [Thermoanaerobaculia bacterium]